MERKMIRMLLGQDPPFILKNLTRCQEKKLKTPVESECSIVRILKTELIDRMYIKGFITNYKGTIPISVTPETDIITFSCFDQLHLFFYYIPTGDPEGVIREYPLQPDPLQPEYPLQPESLIQSESPVQLLQPQSSPPGFIEDGKSHIFYTKFTCCRKWNITTLKATEISPFPGLPQSLTIEIHCRNARKEDAYHYNLCHIKNEKLCFGVVDGVSEEVLEAQCLLCYKVFRFKSDLDLHIQTLHPEYNVETDGKYVTLKRDEKYVEKEILTCLSPVKTPQPGIEFYAEDLFDKEEVDQNDSNIYYIDFDEEITSSPEISVIKNPNESIKAKGTYYDRETDLVNSIFRDKSKKIQGMVMIYMLNRKPLIKDSRQINKRFKAVQTFNFFNWEKGLRHKHQPHISFMKRRTTLLINYELETYGLLIDREFDTLDYSKMLSKHMDLGLKSYASMGLITPRIYALMKMWNRAMVENMNIKTALADFIVSYEINDDVIQFIDLLYSRGLLTSEEILSILRTKR